MRREYTGSEIMEKAVRYARNARRHLFEEEACSSSLAATRLYRRFMEDDDLRELVHIDGFDSATGDFLDSLDGVRLALQSLDKAATNLAAQIGSEMGQQLTQEQALQNPSGRMMNIDEMKAEMLQFIDVPREFIPMHERKKFEQEADCICKQFLLHPLAAWCQAKLLKITASYRALEDEVVWLARDRIQSRMQSISSSSRTFPLVDDQGHVEVVKLPYNWDEASLHDADFFDTAKVLHEEALDALFGRIHSTPDDVLNCLSYFFEREHEQERAVTQVIAGHLLGNECVVRLALAACQWLRAMKSVCSAEFTRAVHDPERWKSSCQIEVITRSGAGLTVDIQQNGSFQKLDCIFRSELSNACENYKPIYDTFTNYIADWFPEAVNKPKWD